MESDHNSGRLIRCTSLACCDSLGEDLLMEIFKTLPIETLCRSRCVCKRWRSLISSPSFITLQHSFTSSSTPPNLKPYLRAIFAYDSHDSFPLYRPPQQTGANHIRRNLHFPFRFPDDTPLHSLSFFDSINGVVCVSYSLGSSFNYTLLWNPSIHKYVALPRLPPRHPDAEAHGARFICNAVGFGFDSREIEFKVVRIWIPYTYMRRRCKKLLPVCEVYSTRQGFWRSVAVDSIVLESLEFSTLGENRGCFVNGTLHWLVSPINPTIHSSVLMFDCEREEFRTTDLPQDIYVKGLISRRGVILEYGGMLAFVLHSCWGLVDREWGTEMWVMEKHGAVSTWKKLYRVIDSLRYDTYLQAGPLFEKTAPYGPHLWKKLRFVGERYNQVMNDHVHEESMFLLDDHEAQSYTKEEIVHITVPIEFTKQCISGSFRKLKRKVKIINGPRFYLNNYYS